MLQAALSSVEWDWEATFHGHHADGPGPPVTLPSTVNKRPLDSSLMADQQCLGFCGAVVPRLNCLRLL